MIPQAESSWTLNEAAHLLNRAGFGGSPAEIHAFHALGRENAVDALLTRREPGDAFPLPPWANRKAAMETMRENFEERRKIQRESRGVGAEKLEELRRKARKEMQQESRIQGLESQGWWFNRMAKTSDPLREKMTLFWHDHFATSFQKVRSPFLLIQQNELFRKHAFGSFKDLTQAVLVDPAMLIYLDTQNSRKGKPNENFAREVMELFTLGEGNYDEQDIREAARAFTGYQANRINGEVSHSKRQWDDTSKTVFGKSGNFTGEDVINLIFEKPEAAPFICRKIWEYFVYETPSENAVKSLAATLRKSDYRMEPLLREIFLSREFYSEAAIRSQIKSPIQFLIQMLKQLEISEPPMGFAINSQQQLGQILFMPPNVAGWDWGQAWINTNTLLARYNIAGFLTKGADDGGKSPAMERTKVKGMAAISMRGSRAWSGPDYEKIAPRSLRENPAELVDSLIFRFFQGPIPDKARGSFIEYANAKKGVIFTDKETAELCHLILSTPYYQLC